MIARLSMLVLAAIALIALGCGDSSPDETVQEYFDAIVEQDGKRACDQLTEQLQIDIEQSPAARNSGRSCADVMELAAGLNPGLIGDGVGDLEIDVEEDGDRAVATVENPFVRREETIDLVKENGDWKIASLETRPRG